MVRAYADEPVAPDAVERILAAANKAPSAGFSQGYALMTLQGPGQLGPFWELMSRYHGDESSAGPSFDPVTRAPLVVVPLSFKDIYLDRYARQDKGWADRDEARWPVPYWDIDIGWYGIAAPLGNGGQRSVRNRTGTLTRGRETARYAAQGARHAEAAAAR